MHNLVSEEGLKEMFPYLDNIAVAGRTQQEHDYNVQQMLDVIHQGCQPEVHWTGSGGALQLEKIFQMKNVPQLISRYIRGGQHVADCTLISSDDLFLENSLVSVGKVQI